MPILTKILRGERLHRHLESIGYRLEIEGLTVSGIKAFKDTLSQTYFGRPVRVVADEHLFDKTTEPLQFFRMYELQ